MIDASLRDNPPCIATLHTYRGRSRKLRGSETRIFGSPETATHTLEWVTRLQNRPRSRSRPISPGELALPTQTNPSSTQTVTKSTLPSRDLDQHRQNRSTPSEHVRHGESIRLTHALGRQRFYTDLTTKTDNTSVTDTGIVHTDVFVGIITNGLFLTDTVVGAQNTSPSRSLCPTIGRVMGMHLLVSKK